MKAYLVEADIYLHCGPGLCKKERLVILAKSVTEIEGKLKAVFKPPQELGEIYSITNLNARVVE